MLAVKRRFGKEDGTAAYHGYQSFAPGEATPEMAHEIGIKLAERLWGNKYQVIVATHLDRENHLHNHFVVNTVSFIDGIKYYRSAKEYHDMQNESDKLCREYGLSVIEEPRGTSKHYGEWRAEQEQRPTWRGIIRAEVDEVIRQSNLLISARSAITAFKEKGKDALVSAVTAMRIPSALDAMKNAFSKAAESMLGNAEKLDVFRDELHEVGFHLKNAGRALFGKPAKESEALKHDKGILGKIRSFMQNTADKYEDMGRSAEKLSTKVKERYEKQKSVKSELKSIKAAQKAEMVKRVPMKEEVL